MPCPPHPMGAAAYRRDEHAAQNSRGSVGCPRRMLLGGGVTRQDCVVRTEAREGGRERGVRGMRGSGRAGLCSLGSGPRSDTRPGRPGVRKKRCSFETQHGVHLCRAYATSFCLVSWRRVDSREPSPRNQTPCMSMNYDLL